MSNDVITDIKQDLLQNRLHVALEKIKKIVPEEHINEFIVICSAFKELERNQRINVISLSEYNSERSSFINRLLKYLDQILPVNGQNYGLVDMNQLVVLFEIRAERINKILDALYPSVNAEFFLIEFNRLHVLHIGFLKDKKLVAAHEILINIYRLFKTLEKTETEISGLMVSSISYAIKEDYDTTNILSDFYLMGQVDSNYHDSGIMDSLIISKVGALFNKFVMGRAKRLGLASDFYKVIVNQNKY